MCREMNGRSVGKEFRNGKQNARRGGNETNGIGRVYEEI